MKRTRFAAILVTVLALAATACGSKPAPAGGGTSPQPAPTTTQPANLPEIEVAVFAPPSLGYFLPPVIKARNLDAKNGINVKFVQRPTTAYNTEMGTGQIQVGGSAALLSEGLRRNKGIKVTYLFNLFDFWGTVVTADANVKSLKDLEGKSLAAAKSTTNYAMFQYFAQKSGASLAQSSVQNAEPAGLVTLLTASRVDAVQIWEPAFSDLMSKSAGKYHEVDYGLGKWHDYTGGNSIPYLGLAAHADWVQQHKDLVPKLYQAYKDAADWVQKNPDEAAKLIAEPMKADPKVIADLIRNNNRLGMNVKPASALKADIMAVMKAGVEISYFDKLPDDGVVYADLH